MVEVFLGKKYKALGWIKAKWPRKIVRWKKDKQWPENSNGFKWEKKAEKHRNKARIKNYEQLLQGIESDQQQRRKMEIGIPNGPRLGDIVVRARGLFKGYGEKLLIDGLDFDMPRGGIVGIIGANGAGKTTLFRMINGEEIPTQGELKVGETVQLSYVSQHRDDLDDNKTVWENISGT